MDISQRYPCVADLEIAARKRIPRFAHEYVSGGLGPEACIARNRDALNEINLTPQYLNDTDKPDTKCNLFGHSYAAPFGVSPVGLGGLVWPHAAQILAAAAAKHNLPFVLSTFATAGLEEIAEITTGKAWLQHYPPKDSEIEKSMLERAKSAGYSVLVVTIDIPTSARRERDMRNGLAFPPGLNLATVLQVLSCPAWALQMLRSRTLEFESVKQYVPPGSSMNEGIGFLADMFTAKVTRERLKLIRDSWPGTLVIKGVLDTEDAEMCVSLGADALVISNHGGRQFDAAPSPLEVLDEIRSTVGSEMPLLVDGGVRSGLDVARCIARGADFVLMGRAFYYAIAALGNKGGNHVMSILLDELDKTMTQLGCSSVDELPNFLSDRKNDAINSH